MSADRLSEIKARAEAATEGPWEVVYGFTTDPLVMVDGAVASVQDWRDGAFIASARTDVPWLIEQVESLTAERDAPGAGVSGGTVMGGDAEITRLRSVLADEIARRESAETEVRRLRTWLPQRIVEQPLLFGTQAEIRHEAGITEGMRTYCMNCSAAHEDWITTDECPQLAEMDVPHRVVSAVRAEIAEDALARVTREADALRAKVAAVQALVDSNPDHADTCGSVLTPGAGYPCSCWQTDLRAALTTTGEGQ